MNTTTQLTPQAQEIYAQLDGENIRLGDIKKIAKQVKKDHDLAMELWSTGESAPRLLAVLIMDRKYLTQAFVETLATDMNVHAHDERLRIADWLLANQLMKSKKTSSLIESWEQHPLPILRRLFWYHQARLRWTGKTPPPNTPLLLDSLTKRMATEEPEVQWAMNFSAGQIGIHEPQYRAQCVELGEKIGLYKGDPVPRGCTPNYLPEFIQIEAAKLDK